MKKTMKRLLACVVVVMMVFAVSTSAFAYSSGPYTGSCLNSFTCNQTWNKINDDILENDNQYITLYSAGGMDVSCISKFAVGSRTHEEHTISTRSVDWENSYTGTCTLTIVNEYYAGTRLYAAGDFKLYDETEA